MCLVSIVIPIYNSSNCISNTINSVLKQTYKDFELILIDDGSSDNSLEICNQFSYDPRIKIISKNNEGVSSTRNLGITLSNGDYVMFVDSDDELSHNMLELLVNQAINENSDLIIGSMVKRYYNNHNMSKEIIYMLDENINNIDDFYINIDKFLANCLIQGPCSKLFKTNILKDNDVLFPINMSYGEDTTFVYSFLKYANSISYEKKAIYIYNVVANSNSLNTQFREDKLETNLELYDKLQNLLKEKKYKFNAEDLNELIRTVYINYCMELYLSNTNFKYKINKFKVINRYPKIIEIFNISKKSKLDLQCKILSFFIKFRLTFLEFLFFASKKFVLNLRGRK